MLNTNPGVFSYQMLNILVVGIFSLISHNAVKTSLRCVTFPDVPDDNSGSDNYHKGVMMKVRNMVRGGAVAALSLGLASLGTGMGLTANHSPSGGSVPSHATTGGPRLLSPALAEIMNPQLVCDPGVTCGTPQAVELLTSRTYDGQTFAVWQMAVPAYSGWTAVGCGVGILAGGVADVIQGGTDAVTDVGEYELAVRCFKGSLGAAITSILKSVLIVPQNSSENPGVSSAFKQANIITSSQGDILHAS